MLQVRKECMQPKISLSQRCRSQVCEPAAMPACAVSGLNWFKECPERAMLLKLLVVVQVLQDRGCRPAGSAGHVPRAGHCHCGPGRSPAAQCPAQPPTLPRGMLIASCPPHLFLYVAKQLTDVRARYCVTCSFAAPHLQDNSHELAAEVRMHSLLCEWS